MGQMRGRRSVNWCHTGIVVLGVLSMTLSIATATQYSVADAAGWITDFNYTEWAARQTFYEGDTIVFSYPRGEHDVLRVSSEDYDACRASNPIETDASGETTFELHEGAYYFICGFPTHCTEGSQKISFNVASEPVPISNPVNTSSNIPNYNQGAETPIAYGPAPGPSGAFAPGAAPAMPRLSLLYSLIILLTLGICGSIL